jgi:hypothetical protein
LVSLLLLIAVTRRKQIATSKIISVLRRVGIYGGMSTQGRGIDSFYLAVFFALEKTTVNAKSEIFSLRACGGYGWVCMNYASRLVGIFNFLMIDI